MLRRRVHAQSSRDALPSREHDAYETKNASPTNVFLPRQKKKKRSLDFCVMTSESCHAAARRDPGGVRQWWWQTPVTLQVALRLESPRKASAAGSWDAVTTTTLAFAHALILPELVRPTAMVATSDSVTPRLL